MDYANKIACEFSRLICQELANDLPEIIRRNNSPEYMGACSTHDFCDANEIMAESFRNAMGRDSEMDAQDSALWNRAWDIARVAGFRMDQETAPETETAKPAGNRKPLYRALAMEIDRYKRGIESGAPFADMAEDRLREFCRDFLPSGSGFDSGCYVEIEESRRDKIVIRCDFHHMNESGYYDGWTTHRAIVTPCLLYGYALRVTGKDKRGIREYIGDTIGHCLDSEISA